MEGPDEKTSRNPERKFRSYAIIAALIIIPIQNWYFIGFDSRNSWLLITFFSFVFGGLLLANKKGWLDGKVD